MKETFMDTQEKDAYAMMNSGLPVDMRDPAFGVVARDMDVTYELTFKYNTTFGTKEERRALLSEILRQEISPDTLVRPPFVGSIPNELLEKEVRKTFREDGVICIIWENE